LHEGLLRDYLSVIEDEAPDSDKETLEAHALLVDLVRARATDLHLDPHQDHHRIRLRIDGNMVDAAEVDASQGKRLVNQFKTFSGIDPIHTVSCSEGSFFYSLEDMHLDLRVTVVPCISGDKLAVRILTPAERVMEVEQLGVSGQGIEWIRQWMDATTGMFLVAGPTGSGKTTTLYSLLQELKLGDSHVVTLEDPVEYAVPGINQIQVDNDNGLSFTRGTQAMLRLDPDYVLLGEIRDSASASAAVSVSSSGRALMGTLHSRDAVGTVTALRNLGLDDYEIASNLGLVVAQRLVRTLCQACKVEREPDHTEQQWLRACDRDIPEKTWAPVGCPKCDGLGFHGRMGVFEVWQLTEQDHTMILAHEEEQALRYSVSERGTPRMLDDGLAKAAEGLTTLRELLRAGTLLPTRRPDG
jgi:type II secretory ATPase GspE/PulE/Tfp pilus assembly ATPase PilB-like protein